ncbi:MAG: hypothetical protein KJ737_28235, partial [Proteobacteria bacterium]|nr:hypothetical protein [Pseudomonadota bacterium]
MSEKDKGINPLLNIFRTEWIYLGERRKFFVLSTGLFLIAGLITLMNPLVIGLIFNSIQESITSDAELKKLISMIFLLLGLNVGFQIFHCSGRILEELTGFHVHRHYTNEKIRRILELPVKWHKDNHSGDTIDKLNRARNSVKSVSSSLIFQV